LTIWGWGFNLTRNDFMQQFATVVQSLEDLVGVLEEWAHG